MRYPVTVALTLTLTATAPSSAFVNFESPHVNPLDLTPDASRLLAVNTADNRLEVYATGTGGLDHVGSVPVGLEPVSVRARTNTEAWVVNHVSDSVSVVDLVTLSVIATVQTGDEPADVAFAGVPERAFVSVSQLNEVRVFDPADLTAAPVIIPIQGEDPRALATDGSRVFAAVHESGNRTTILGENDLSMPAINPYAGDPNPPPNSGSGFDPPIAGGLSAAPGVSHIVRKDAGGNWLDDNGGDWSNGVTWDLLDHDVAVIDAGTLGVSYVTGLMNANMNLAVTDAGDLLVIGTDATNEVRFEPNLTGVFLRVVGARITPPASTATTIADINPHLDYSVSTIAPAARAETLGDPRGVDWSAAHGRAYVAGLGSNSVIAVSADFARLDRATVGQGPTAVRASDGLDRLYVLNRFDASITVLDQSTLTEVETVTFHDATPQIIRDGRPFLYDTQLSSGLGLTSCGSCHIDGRMDQISWDLGDPTGAMKPFDQVCNGGLIGGCEDWHPMKGPMATQTLVGSLGTGPLHWRADRASFDQFNPAFVGLLGRATELTPTEIAQFEAFVATLTYPPNPNRNRNDSLKSSIPTTTGSGNAVLGSLAFNTAQLDGVNCSDCHALPTGTNGQLTSANLILESQSMKIPQLRNMHEKTGFSRSSQTNHRGFGFTHDGSVDTLFEFFEFPGFSFSGDQQQRDVEAFMLSFATDTHAGVGAQSTLGGPAPDSAGARNALILIANAGQVDLVAHGTVAGEARGYAYLGGGQYQSDRASETITTTGLDTAVADGDVVTWTLVPLGSATRIGIDRDEDGHLDRDEIDGCFDPADADSNPDAGNAVPGCGATCAADLDGNGSVGFTDLNLLLATWGPCGAPCGEDLDGNGVVGFADLNQVLEAWGSCGP